ncbi:MAG: hypothetical protein J1E85_07405 [Ruminococcus sp.]|nr:hypothetical protein [Ruminococcus sp.]
MSIPYLTGLFVGILFVLIFFMIFLIFKKKKPMNQYDERQKAIQGVAYKVGFFAMFAYFLFNGLICMEIGNWLPMLNMNFIGIGVGLLCYAGYAIFKDAYISLNTKPMKTMLSLAAISAVNYICFFINYNINNENPEIFLTSLICAILLTLICIMIIIKAIIDKCCAKKELIEE